MPVVRDSKRDLPPTGQPILAEKHSPGSCNIFIGTRWSFLLLGRLKTSQADR